MFNFIGALKIQTIFLKICYLMVIASNWSAIDYQKLHFSVSLRSPSNRRTVQLQPLNNPLSRLIHSTQLVASSSVDLLISSVAYQIFSKVDSPHPLPITFLYRRDISGFEILEFGGQSSFINNIFGGTQGCYSRCACH